MDILFIEKFVEYLISCDLSNSLNIQNIISALKFFIIPLLEEKVVFVEIVN